MQAPPSLRGIRLLLAFFIFALVVPLALGMGELRGIPLGCPVVALQ